MIPAALPILRDAHGLTFTQVGLITLVIQVTSSLLQPLVVLTTDKHPTKYMLAIGMCSTLVGLVALSQASVFASMLLAVAFLGFGSAVFHPVAKDWLKRSFRSEETPAWLWGRSLPLSL